MKRLTIPATTFDRLAAGGGQMAGVLRSGQRSKRLLLLHELRSAAARDSPATFAEAGAEESYGVLADAHRHRPRAVDEVVLHPHIGVWVTSCLRHLVTGSKIPREDMGHLGGIAAAAAIRAGRGFEVTAYARDGWVMLPTYGAVLVGDIDGWCRVRSGSEGSRIEITAPGTGLPLRAQDLADRESATWRPIRRIEAAADGVTFAAEIDDIDPYRCDGQLAVADRLAPRILEAWERHLAHAWRLLVEQDREHAAALADGVHVIVPLRSTDVAAELSASHPEGVGSVAMTPPTDPLSLGLALVHEFQHNKLTALFDLVALVEVSRDARFHAPWRSDPRPLWGLLHGTYAFLGLAVFWESVRGRLRDWDPEANEDWAQFEFAHARFQVESAIEELLGADGLHSPGRWFVQTMQRRLLDLARLDVPALPLESARLACLDHERSWRLRNVRLDATRVTRWTDAWCAGRSFPGDDGRDRLVIDGDDEIGSSSRLSLLRRRLASPGSWRQDLDGTSAADAELVSCHIDAAALTYEDEISESPDDRRSWAGLSLIAAMRPSAKTRAMCHNVEAVYALHRAIRHRTGDPPDLGSLISWMSAPGT